MVRRNHLLTKPVLRMVVFCACCVCCSSTVVVRAETEQRTDPSVSAETSDLSEDTAEKWLVEPVPVQIEQSDIEIDSEVDWTPADLSIESGADGFPQESGKVYTKHIAVLPDITHTIDVNLSTFYLAGVLIIGLPIGIVMMLVFFIRRKIKRLT